MKFARTLTLLVALFAAVHALIDIDLNLGALLTLDIGENTLSFLTGEVLSITVSAAASVRLELAADTPELALPDAFLDAGLGYKITIDSSEDVVASGNLKTKALATSFTDKIGTEVDAVVALVYDKTNEWYHQLDDCVYDAATRKLTFSFNGGGEIRVSGKSGNELSLPTIFNYPRAIVANAEEVNLVFPLGVEIDISAEASFDLTVDRKTESNANFEGRAALGVYLDISQSTKSAVDAVIRLQYNAEQVAAAGIEKVENLRLAVYNEADAAWEFVAGGSVDVEANVIIQSTTHFSTWGAFEATEEDLGSGASSMSVGTMAMVLAALLLLV